MNKKITCTFLVLISCSYLALSQNCYQVTEVPYQPAPYVAANIVGPMMDDEFSASVAIGFNFCFFDVSYDSLVIASNGYVTFDLTQAYNYCPWPITDGIPNTLPGVTPFNAIMSPWQDVDPSVSIGTVSYELQGIAPYRRMVVSYDNLSMYSCNGDLFTNQLILYETTNIIEVNIAEKSVCDTWNDGAAIEGIQNADGTEAYVVPGRNYPVQWVANHDSWRFIPTCGCAGPAPSNLISGKIFADYNNDCVFNGTDAAIQNQWVLANNGQFYAYADNGGDYELWVDTGNYIIDHSILPFFTSKCPAGGDYNIEFTTTEDTISNIDFADTTEIFCSDLSIDVGVPNLTQCFYENGGITYCNYGTIVENDILITLTLPDSLQLTSSSVTAVPLGNGQYQFDGGSLSMGDCGSISFSIDVGCDTVGTVLCMDAAISGSSPDCDTTNNLATDCHDIIASFDPNGIEVASQDFALEGYVTVDTINAGDDLTYLIHFQNTGSDTAYNIIVKDTLSAYLDDATIEAGASGHPYTWVLQNGVLIFQFNNIRLPDSLTNPAGSMGFVKFTIHQQSGNLPGTVISNRAAIFFDYNLPIITNTTLNIIPLSDETEIDDQSGLDVKVYPNPFHDEAEVVLTSEPQHFQLYVFDLLGRKVMEMPCENSRAKLDRGSLQDGVYFLRIQLAGSKVAIAKLIVQ